MNWTSSRSSYLVAAGVEARLGLGVFNDALPTAGVRPVDPWGKIGSEKRAFFFGLARDGVAVVEGLTGDMAELGLFDRRTVIVSTEVVSAIVADEEQIQISNASNKTKTNEELST